MHVQQIDLADDGAARMLAASCPAAGLNTSYGSRIPPRLLGCRLRTSCPAVRDDAWNRALVCREAAATQRYDVLADCGPGEGIRP